MQTVQLSNEKCPRHSQRYCPEPGCYTPLIPNQETQSPKPAFEDQLIGRTKQQPIKSDPKIQIANRRPAETQTVQAPELQATALVQASKAYADAVTAVEKALAIVSDLERRLEFCRENAAEAIKAKDEAFQRVKSLVGESHE